MPSIGELLTLKVEKVTKYGAFLSNKHDTNDYFLPIKEISDKWVESIFDELSEGQIVTCRFLHTKRVRGKQQFNVSLKMVDEDVYKTEMFNKKIQKFMDRSSEIQSQIKKNRERKQNNGRKKKRLK